MRKFKTLLFGGLLAVLLISCGKNYDQLVEIESRGNQMKYNVVKINAQKGSKLLIKFSNNATMDIMKHNIVILKNEDAIDEVGKAAISAKDYLPENSNILAASTMIGPGEVTELLFDVPNEKGVYPYICTFPGHYQVMQGQIIVE